MEHTCPICNKSINSTGQEKNEEQKFLPFCSERCKLLDLGSWLDADYKILSAQKSQENDQDFDLPELNYDNP
jgi:endogenous inhibitor of DNA gyrase (YacG/DUF329 family)